MERGLTDNLAEAQIPIYDYEAEKAVLSLCLKSTDAINQCISNGITKDVFADNRNVLVFDTIEDIYKNSGTIDRFTVTNQLERKGLINSAGGLEYIFQVADTKAVLSNIESYCKIVLEKYKLRKIVTILDRMDKDARSGRATPTDLVDYAIDRFSGLRDDNDGKGFEVLSSIIRSNLQAIHKNRNGEESRRIIRTGFKGLDMKLGGLRPGTLNVLAARPGMGKTALVINIATNVASFKNTPVNIFSLEMSKAEIANRILASRANVTVNELNRANVSLDKEKELIEAFKGLSHLGIYIDDTSAVTPAKMIASCKELKAKGELGLVIIDYLQLMSSSDSRRSGSRQEEISDISRSLKVLAKDLDVPVIALSQLSRGSEKREDHTPQLSDLRDSGAIEQDADSVIFIDRDDYYKKKDENLPEIQDAKLIVSKNRHGETGVVKVKWWGAKTLFFEESRQSDPVDPAQSGSQSPYTRVQSSGASASDYKFDDSPAAPAPEVVAEPIPPYEGPASQEAIPDPVPPFTGDEDDGDGSFGGGDNSSNDDYFADSATDFPEGFM